MPAQDAETVDETRVVGGANERESGELQIQPAGFLIQLSLDWIVLRASENVDDLLGESHVTLIEEPFSPDDIESHAELGRRLSFPVATGEIEDTIWPAPKCSGAQ